LNVQPALKAIARASMVLATPGTSSISKCPSASQTATASVTASCLPTITFSTLAMSWPASDAISAAERPLGAATGGRIVIGFFLPGISMVVMRGFSRRSQRN